MNTEFDRDELTENQTPADCEKQYGTPQLRQVGDVSKVQGLYEGWYYDGPNSYYWYDG